MAAPRLLFGEPEPNLVLAAEAGDVEAMKVLGRFLYRSGGRELAERWLFVSAESGDPEAMFYLSRVYGDRAVNRRPHGDSDDVRAANWCRRAAQAGWPEAISRMGELRSVNTEEQEFWLRRAAEAGDWPAMTALARLADKQKRPDDAEHWYRMAVDHSASWVVRASLSDRLMKQGRMSEAEELLRQAAEAGSAEDARQLADVLSKLGREQEASAWREKHEVLRARDAREMEEFLSLPVTGTPELATVAVTALVTTAVVPFIQALVGHAAEEAYGHARGLVSRMLRRDGEPTPAADPDGESASEQEPRLLIADDAEAGITLFVWSNASDEALRALSSLDMDELTARRPDQGRVRLVWHPETGRWHIRGE